MLKINKNNEKLVEELLSTIRQFPKIMARQTSQTSHTQKRSEIMVLFCIKKSEQGEMKVTEISRKLHVKAPTVTQLLNELESKGQVERMTRTSDRRSVWVKLTEKGEETLHLAMEQMQKTYSGLIDYLGEEETIHLIETLKKMHIYFLNNMNDENKEGCD